jgi:hypothetical protein
MRKSANPMLAIERIWMYPDAVPWFEAILFKK